MRQSLIQPPQGTIEVDLDPTRSAGDVLPVIFRPPSFNKTNPYSAHLGQLIHRLKTEIDAPRQQVRELRQAEDLQGATGRYFANGGRIESVVVVAAARLHKNRRVRQTFRVNFVVDITQVNSFPYVLPRVLYGGVAVDVAQLAETEAVAVLVRRLCESVDRHRWRAALKDFPDAGIQFVVSD